jgi:site-specific recombinase XerD
MAASNSTPTGTAFRLDTKKGREALAPRRDPYFQPIQGAAGASLGFRKIGEPGTDDGTWIVRLREGTAYAFESLGRQPDYHAAARKAGEWIKLREQGVTDTGTTVKQLCKDFADAVEKTEVNGRPERPKYAKTLRDQYSNWINNAPIGRIPVAKLKAENVAAWRENLRSTDDIHKKPRSNMSMNREMSALRAALNWGHKTKRLTPSDAAWANPLRVIKLKKNEGTRRDVYLSPEQRAELLANAEPDVRQLMRAMSVIPARPGALAKLNAGDFDKNLGVLNFGDDKTENATGRSIQLPADIAAFFAEQVKGKLPAAPMFIRTLTGKRWTSHTWKRAVTRAVHKSFTPGTKAYQRTTMYVLRHCSITDLARHGVSLSDIAELAGTSTAEIEKHYKHLLPSVGQKLAALARFAKA